MTPHDRHTLTAVQAVLEHTLTHHLPLPEGIEFPGHYLGAELVSDTIGINLGTSTVDQLAAWEESLGGQIASHVTRHVGSLSGPEFDHMRHTIEATLPVGVRVTLVARLHVLKVGG